VRDLYELRVTGTLGPLMQACLPEFTTAAESPATVLTGTVEGPDDLSRLLDLLAAHGMPALDVHITSRRE
jgi:hypothetical protein